MPRWNEDPRFRADPADEFRDVDRFDGRLRRHRTADVSDGRVVRSGDLHGRGALVVIQLAARHFDNPRIMPAAPPLGFHAAKSC